MTNPTSAVAAQVEARFSLELDAVPCEQGLRGITVYPYDLSLMVCIEEYLLAGRAPESILRVRVLPAGAPIEDNVADILGRYQILENGLRFVPYFPFEPGVSYQARFHSRPLSHLDSTDALVLEFSLPNKQSCPPPKINQIFPSGNYLPENLLRFYVFFTNPMRRGQAQSEITLVGPDGAPATDVLYRAPLELWDKSMKCLTVLLDPGRLKRGVGPNRELGPPLKSGEAYTLAVGAGMKDLDGNPLGETVYKRFKVTDAVRQPITVEQWKVTPPQVDTFQALVLRFPRPMDWALISNSITVASLYEQSPSGRIAIDQSEMQWRFTPTFPWAVGSYRIDVKSSLEDVCGNSINAPFDRTLRSHGDLATEVTTSSIPFDLQCIA